MSAAICTTCWDLRRGCALEEPCSCTTLPPAGDACTAEGRLRCIPCSVCGLRIVRGHTRWCLRVCKGCKLLAVPLNASVGRCVVPIGVHSIVNGVALQGGPRDDVQRDREIERFAAQLSTVMTTVGELDDFGRRLLRARVERFDLSSEPAVSWEVYLEACTSHGVTAGGAWDALFGLVELEQA